MENAGGESGSESESESEEDEQWIYQLKWKNKIITVNFTMTTTEPKLNVWLQTFEIEEMYLVYNQ